MHSKEYNWIKALEIGVPMNPMGTPRGRATGKICKKGKKLFVQAWVYNPADYKKYIKELKTKLQDHVNTLPDFKLLDCALKLTVSVGFCTKGRKMEADLDNYIKAVKDSCNGVLWKDDVQVCQYGENTCKYPVENPEDTILSIRVDMDSNQVPYRKSWRKPVSPKKRLSPSKKTTRRKRREGS